MSEFTEKLLASIIKKNNQGYLILKNCGTLFDSTLGVGGVTHSLNLVIRPERGQEIISEESIKPEDISISPKDNGYKIKLSTETFNNVSSQVNRYNGKFETIVKEYTTADNKVCGGPHEFATSPEGDISLILDSQTPDAQYVNGPASSSDAAQSASSEALFSGVKQDMPNNPGAAPATATKKKSLLFPIIASIIALLLLLLAFLWWKGVFNGEDNIVEQEPQVTSSQSADETAVQNTQKEESDDNSAKAENNNPVPENSAVAEQPQNQNSEEPVPSDATSSQTASAGAGTGACVLSAQKDDEIISNCLSSNPKIDVISSLSQQSLENDRCDLGKRLLSSYGRKDSAAAYLFAKYFDPNSSSQSKCIQKDKTQAIYWYQKASDLGMTEAKDAIGKLKE